MGFIRKYLSADGLHQIVRHCVGREKLAELKGSEYSWQDCVMSGLAIFGFKCPSLLQFEKKKATEPMVRRNLRTLYRVENAPSDTCLRERLDRVHPRHLRRAFKTIFAYLQRGKALESFQAYEGHYVISIDGTGQYSSEQVHCVNCCQKKHRNGKITYYHHMLGACLVHPKQKVVIPLAPEPILKGDGASKNDCERNAAKRLLTDLRREHPHLKVLIVEDSLASNYPHLSLLDSLNMKYIVGVKPGDHTFLFDWIKDLKPSIHHHYDPDEGIHHEFQYYDSVPLNDAHFNYRVNVLLYTEISPTGKRQHFSWVTKIPLDSNNVYELMRIGRSRWHIENETFNTLKNQGYHFAHNYGHGYQHLCTVMTQLMLLAFLIDQVQQLCCTAYQKARQHVGNFSVLFEKIRVLIEFVPWNSFLHLLTFIGDPTSRPPPQEIFVIH